MTESAQQYEVFIESVAGATDGQPPLAHWSWQRLDEGGEIVVRGSLHISLAACFASVRLHSVEFGHAPVKINL